MDRATEDRLLALAVARGDLRLEDWGGRECRAAGSRIERLVASGRLAATTVDDLQVASPAVCQHLLRAAGLLGPQGPQHHVPAGATRRAAHRSEESVGTRSSSRSAVAAWVRSTTAFDPSLARHVALKVLRSDSPELAQRFVREAQAQARIDHPNVCQVLRGRRGGRTAVHRDAAHRGPDPRPDRRRADPRAEGARPGDRGRGGARGPPPGPHPPRPQARQYHGRAAPRRHPDSVRARLRPGS